jgi:CPA2 family monovalent cation:H+ antiporter-2
VGGCGTALAAAGGEHTPAAVLLQLGVVLFGLGLLGLLAHRVNLSPVPLYLLAGLAFGEHGPLPLVTDAAGTEFIAVGAELGAVLLLLSLGLEYAPDELVAGLRRNAGPGVIDLLLNATPGAALALLLGWGPVAAVALGGVTYVSSSGIIAKVLADLGHLGNRETPVVIAVLVLEDLAMAAYLPVLTALLAGVGVYAATASMALALVAVLAVFVAAMRFPGMLARLVFAPNDEVLLLRVLGLALLVAGLAAQANVSATVGAFLVGVSLSGPVAASATELLRPLRDLFAAVFFVFFGLQIDPTQIPGVLGLAAALAAVTAATKIATGWWAAARAGIGRPGRVRAGVALIPRGEFSIVIAGLTTAAGASGTISLDPRFGPLAAAYVLLLAVLGPLGSRLVDPRRRLRALPDSGCEVAAVQERTKPVVDQVAEAEGVAA